jgi:heme/copper-type cytochrome/quinol oxidase subunit 2
MIYNKKMKDFFQRYFLVFFLSFLVIVLIIIKVVYGDQTENNNLNQITPIPTIKPTIIITPTIIPTIIQDYNPIPDIDDQ